MVGVGLKVTLLVCGSVAAYKAADVGALLRRQGADVRVALSPAALRFVAPLTLEAVTGHAAVTDLWAGGEAAEVHLELAAADALGVVAASADRLARLALGLAEDVVGATFLAYGDHRPAVIAPAMETGLWRHPVTQGHVARLVARGHRLVGPVEGPLASGRQGEGRLAEPEAIVRALLEVAQPLRDLAGLTVLVTAGPTREAWDPVRFLSSPSSGRMGLAVAARALARGAKVILVHGPMALEPPPGVEAVPVTTAREMAEAVRHRVGEADLLVGTAAVSDYRPAHPLAAKLRKGPERLTLELVANPDVVAEAAQVPGRAARVHVGFAAEVGEPVAGALAKMEAKDLDLVVANDVSAPGAGFGVDTNRVTLVTRPLQPGDPPQVEPLPLLAKEEVADRLLDRAAALWRRRRGAPAPV